MDNQVHQVQVSHTLSITGVTLAGGEDVHRPAVATIPDCAITEAMPQTTKLMIVNCSKMGVRTIKTMPD